MMINSITTIYFSPTGTTKKIVNAIVKGIGVVNSTVIDLTVPSGRKDNNVSIDGDIIIIGVPVYEEKIPEILNSYFNNLTGNGKPVVLVSVYGNIGDGIVLNELEVIAEKSGLKVVAAGSFIGEHSFSTDKVPIAKNRPSNEDLDIAKEFGCRIMEKMKNTDSLNEISLEIPRGKLPLMAKIAPKNSARIFTRTPIVDKSRCSKCNVCVKLCPMGAIDAITLEIEEEKCLRCFCCVKKCSKNARKIIYKPKFIVSKVLTMKNKDMKIAKLYY